MVDREKVFDALRNCVTEPKCKDCPWEDCEKFGCKRVTVPVTLLLDTLKVLREQPTIVRCKDCKYAKMTIDGDLCKYCELDEDENGFLREVYRDADWFCADGERR